MSKINVIDAITTAQTHLDVALSAVFDGDISGSLDRLWEAARWADMANSLARNLPDKGGE